MSAGKNNSDLTWSLTPLHLNRLTFTPPDNYQETYTLTVRVLSIDTDGYGVATTIALFDLLVSCDAGTAVPTDPAIAAKLEAGSDVLDPWIKQSKAPDGDSPETVAKQREELEARLSEAEERWRAEEEKRLAEFEARLKAEEQERLAQVEARLKAEEQRRQSQAAEQQKNAEESLSARSLQMRRIGRRAYSPAPTSGNMSSSQARTA